MNYVNNACHQAERFFNLADNIPTLGGVLPRLDVYGKSMPEWRVQFGLVQVALGLIAFVGGSMAKGVGKAIGSENWNLRGRVATHYGAQHAYHGMLNILQGKGESFLQKYSVGIGSFALLLFYANRNFNPLNYYASFLEPQMDRSVLPQPGVNYAPPIWKEAPPAPTYQ